MWLTGFDALTVSTLYLDKPMQNHTLSEEELEFFDLLKKEKLTKVEKQKVKLAAQHLLHKLKDARDIILIQAWHKEIRSQEKVRREIQVVLNSDLPDSYDRELFNQKTDVIFQHFYNLAEQGVGAVAIQ
jgi:type I restriction enzyme, R subunit